MIARLVNWYRRHIHRHPAAQDRRARAELARKARIAADAKARARYLTVAQSLKMDLQQ